MSEERSDERTDCGKQHLTGFEPLSVAATEQREVDRLIPVQIPVLAFLPYSRVRRSGSYSDHERHRGVSMTTCDRRV
ncbi:hypothetical protein, partial [Halolamina salina]